MEMKRKIEVSALVGTLVCFLPIWVDCGIAQYLTIGGISAIMTWATLTDCCGFDRARLEEE